MGVRRRARGAQPDAGDGQPGDGPVPDLCGERGGVGRVDGAVGAACVLGWVGLGEAMGWSLGGGEGVWISR